MALMWQHILSRSIKKLHLDYYYYFFFFYTFFVFLNQRKCEYSLIKDYSKNENERLAALLKSSLTEVKDEMLIYKWGHDNEDVRQLRGLLGDSQLPVWSLVYLMRSELLLVGCAMSGGGGTWDGHWLHRWVFQRDFV